MARLEKDPKHVHNSEIQMISYPEICGIKYRATVIKCTCGKVMSSEQHPESDYGPGE